jgi:hypothetical protein
MRETTWQVGVKCYIMCNILTEERPNGTI